MAKRFRVAVEYDGTDFSGWQRQSDQRTVQGTLEDALHEMTGESVFVRGAGRTDAGVHADGQVGDLRDRRQHPAARPPARAQLGPPPRRGAGRRRRGAADFDARFSARGKVYRYTVWNHFVRSPRRARRAWHVREPLDVEAIRVAAAGLVGDHDFRAFRASDCDRRTTRRIVRRLDIDRQGAVLTIDVEATAFLKNMVRILVGTLVDVGRGRVPHEPSRACWRPATAPPAA